MESEIIVPFGTLAATLIGVIVAIVKLGPERSQIVVGYQGQIIEDLRAANAEAKAEAKAAKEEAAACRVELEQERQECDVRIRELAGRVAMLQARLSE